MTAAYFIPAQSAAGAEAVVAGIELGRIPCLREYRAEVLARICFTRYPQGYRKGLRLWRVAAGSPTIAIADKITESAGAEGMDRCARDALAVGHRALGVQEARHVA